MLNLPAHPLEKLLHKRVWLAEPEREGMENVIVNQFVISRAFGKRFQNKLLQAQNLSWANIFDFGDFSVWIFFSSTFANYVAGVVSSVKNLQYWLTYVHGECFCTTFP